MEQNTNLRKETSGRKPFIKVLVSVLVAALAAFVMLPLTSTMTKADENKASVTISKVDSEGNPLAGAKLHIEDESGNTVVSQWESAQNKAIVELSAGKYYLVEDDAPEGYKKVDTKTEFIVEEEVVDVTSPTANSGAPHTLPDGKIQGGTFLIFDQSNIDRRHGFSATVLTGSDRRGVSMPDIPAFCLEPSISVKDGVFYAPVQYNHEYQVYPYTQDYFNNCFPVAVRQGYFGGRVPDAERLLRVAYAGSSGDGLGYSSRAANDDEFARATQLAIWNVSANKAPDYLPTDSDEFKALVSDLIAAADSDISLPAYNAVLVAQRNGLSGQYSQPFMVASFGDSSYTKLSADPVVLINERDTTPVTPGDDTPDTPGDNTPDTPSVSGKTNLIINAKKTFDGGNLTAGQFTFQILNGNKTVCEAKNDAEGNITFQNIPFSAAGTYTYTIKEVLPEGVNAENPNKDGITYDTDEKTVVVEVVNENNKLSVKSVKVNGKDVEVKTTSSAGTSTPAVNLTFTSERLFANNAIGAPSYGIPTQIDEEAYTLISAGEYPGYCLDDGRENPTGQSYTEFNSADANDLDAETIKTIKKLLYFGAPNDSGSDELTNWIINEGSKSGNDIIHSYSKEEALELLRCATEVILHNYTNEKQGVDVVDEGINTKEIFIDIIDKETGELINDIGITNVYNSLLSKLWKKVIDPNTDSVAELVDLHFYTATNSPNRAEDSSLRQRIVVPVFSPVESASVTVDAFRNKATKEVVIAKKWADGTADADKVAVTMNLMQNGNKINEVVLSAENDWSHEWKDLEKADANGNQYDYTVEEVTPEGFYIVRKTAMPIEATGGISIIIENKKLGEIATTVKVGDKTASANAEVTLTAEEAAATTTVVDTIHYKGLQAGNDYNVTGTLMKVDGENVTSTGKTATATLRAKESGEGDWEITFTDVRLEAGCKYVVYEEAVNAKKDQAEAGDKAEHKDPADKAQTIVVEEPAHDAPTVKTTAEAEGLEAAEGQTVKDTVILTNLVEGVEYTITGKLMVKEDNAEVATYTCEPVTFTATAADEAAEKVTKTMNFTNIDATDLGGKSLVVFETLSWTGDAHADENGTTVNEVKHDDINDTAQTVTVEEEKNVPTVKTTAEAEDLKAESNQTVVDTIDLTNLKEGVEYTITGKLMVKEDNKEVETYTSEPVKFTATAADEAAEKVTKTMNFTNIDATDLGGKSLVVFETLSWTGDAHADENGTTVNEVKHDDINDTAQTVTVEKAIVKINKTDMGGEDIAGAEIKIYDSEGKEIDKWTSEKNKTKDLKLSAGEYSFKETNAPKGYICVTTEIKFEVKEDGTVEVKTTKADPAGAIETAEDGTIILKDELKDYNVEISKTDMGGTEIAGAKIKVTGTDDAGKAIKAQEWTSEEGKTKTLTLKPGTYILEEVNAPEGYQKVTTKIGFTVGKDGKVTVTTTKVDPAGACEVVNGVLVLKDAIEETPDEPSTPEEPKQPSIATVATDNADGDKNVVAERNAEVKDVVTYTNLIPGKNYTMEGKLVKKSDGTDVAGATASKTFTADESGSGTVELVFIFDSSDLAGGSAVAFETAKDGDKVIATHDDINDAAQTVDFTEPEIQTSAIVEDDENNNKKKIDLVADKDTYVTIKDVVVVSNLTPFKTYTMEGKLVKKSDGTDIAGATASKAFTADKNGNARIELSFVNVNADSLAGDACVAFEMAYKDGGVVARHNDINDLAQTVEISKKPELPDTPGEDTPDTPGDNTPGEDTPDTPGEDTPDTPGDNTPGEDTPDTPGEDTPDTPGDNTPGEDTPDTPGEDTPDTPGEDTPGEDTPETPGEDTPGKDTPKTPGNLATIVKANGKEANSDTPSEIDIKAASGDVTITDTITYTNMAGGATYEVTGQLMKIVEGKEPEVVKTVTVNCTADSSGSGEWTMDFGSVTVAQDTKYVVFETAENKADSGDKVEHKNPEDKAQTVRVLPFFEVAQVDVVISKQDATTSKELPGATLVVRNDAGAIVEGGQWISGTTPKTIKLAPGNYTLTEITAPDGYLKAETIAFTVDESGLVGSDKVVMLDDKASKETVASFIGMDLTAEKFWTTEWPEGVSVTFTLEYFADGEWKTYYKPNGETYTVTIAKGEKATFTDLPLKINDKTAQYRVVEDAVDGYNVKSWKGSDIDNYDGEMSVTNQPNGGKQQTTPGTKTTDEQTQNNQTPTSEGKDNQPQNNDKAGGTNPGTSTTGSTTPVTGKVTSGGNPATPVTTRRAGTAYSASTPASSKATSTGDSNSAVLWIVLAAAAAAAIAGSAVVVTRRRRHED